jgi:hypothetical protein
LRRRHGEIIYKLPKRLIPVVSHDRTLISVYDGTIRKRKEWLYDLSTDRRLRLTPGCFAAARVSAGYVLSCTGPEGKGRKARERSDLMLMTPEGTTLITEAPYTVPKVGAVGHWDSVVPSPDGSTLLAQWSGECEIPEAFFVSLYGSGARPLIPHGRHGGPNTTALGWSPDGRAFAFVPKSPGCGGEFDRSGVYRFDPEGEPPELVFPTATDAYVTRWYS